MFGNSDNSNVEEATEPTEVEVPTPQPPAPAKHTHVWLPANNGRELVCGDCGERKANR